MSPNAGGGGGGVGSCGVSVNELEPYTGAQINFGDLTPCITYGILARFKIFRKQPKTSA